MVLSRIGFGFLGNILPAGIGWFAVNSVSGAFALSALFGWNPYASDYTRYLPPDTNRKATGLWAGLGVFLSCAVLEIVGAAAATITSLDKFGANPTAGFTSNLPTWIADITLLAIALGAICANALNVYSGSMSFLALGIKLPGSLRRAIVAIVFGVAGFFVALSGLHDAGAKYNYLQGESSREEALVIPGEQAATVPGAAAAVPAADPLSPDPTDLPGR